MFTLNRLAKEKSPYLLQHAHNPVNWYPWGDEAFAEARRRDVPIFLSIGYSTCHWCHVMERETFEDKEAALALSDAFVCIKVDREERPDIDATYMAVCQAMTGQGGWPLTILMTADKEPFFSGTYFPKKSRHGRPGIVDVCASVKKSWAEKRSEVLGVASQVTAQLKKIVSVSPLTGTLDEGTFERAYKGFASRYDSQFGGFGSAPKFPSPHNLSYLLRYYKQSGEKKALDMVVETLRHMGRGGVYDQIGFGFHRYATDREWLLPHFEKMLYDQALISIAYTEAYQITKDEDLKQKAQEIFEYVLRDMTSTEGGFYSAEDADSEGEEGKFYVWSIEELRRVLGQDADLALSVYNATPEGNFINEATHKRTGTNILHLRQPSAELAEAEGVSPEDLKASLEPLRTKLFSVRKERIHPYKDDKVLTDWNGLMIAALAIGGRAFNEPRYLTTATKAADFVLERLRDKGGRLLKRYRDGEAGLPAHVDDYAFMVWGMIELYQATFLPCFLKAALELNDTLIEHYWDKEQGGCYITAHDQTDLPIRPKEVHDGAIPSGNSVAALNNLRLARLTGKQELEEIAEKTISAFAGDVARHPMAYTYMLMALDFSLGKTHEIVLAGDIDSPDTKEIIRGIAESFLPRTVVLLNSPEAEQELAKLAPFTAGQTKVNDRATAYVCSDFACMQPSADVNEVLQTIQSFLPLAIK
ncbi:MAG: thioredoxin domain-containing protein [Peptococcaceae bacterium]|nr:thioredoxin domain-containing protein [Peptococcaceae bacterium]